MMKLEGKVALVTGGGRGIGRGIALALAAEGADVAVADLDSATAKTVASEIEKLGRRAITVDVDVTQWDQVQTMVSRTVDELGRVDIAVQNAGVVRISTVEEMEEAVWDHVMAVNAKGVFLCCKAVIPVMKGQGGGKIINISSISGKRGAPTMAAYSASKFAVVGFTNSLAKELARDNITVNAICPGIIRTAMWDFLADKWKNPGETVEDSWQRHLDRAIPQGRAQTPEDMGHLAVYFATADNVTGQAVNVDGGAELH